MQCSTLTLRRVSDGQDVLWSLCFSKLDPSDFLDVIPRDFAMHSVALSIWWAASLYWHRGELTTRLDFQWSSFLPSSKVLVEIPFLVLLLSYSFYADRTRLFNKIHKNHDPRDFTVLCLTTLAFGVLSIRRCATPVRNATSALKTELEDQPVLSRDQTDEWKGWMQFFILIYHFTGSSQILWIYKLVRILVASYLFMTGFGHTIFFYRKKDYTLHRCAAVLIRLNFMSCFLPYVMGTDYLFYYFAPLITFWYMTIYLTMRIGQSRNSNVIILISKIIISACIITLLINVPQVLESIFALLRYTSNIKWDVSEWRFRLQLDAYIVFVGMICGIAFVEISAILRDEQTEKKPLAPIIRHHRTWIRRGLMVAAFTASLIYWYFAKLFSTKVDYNRWVPYLSWVPILSFVILRNCTRAARNYRSSLFVWLGQHSLETFTLQFHIWLAADTKGLLAMGIFGRHKTDVDARWIESVLLTIVFFWMSWRAAAATAAITSWIVGPKTTGNIGEPSSSGTEVSSRPGRDEFIENRVRVAGETELLIRVWQRLRHRLRDSLAARLILIMGTMWILNWVSHFWI